MKHTTPPRTVIQHSNPVWAPCIGLLCAVFGCISDVEHLEESRAASYPTASLYTPGSTLGASDPTDIPNPAAGQGARCNSLPVVADAGVPTQGTLTVEYSTQTIDGEHAPKNCSAVWIETIEGKYVATLEIVGALQRPNLVYFHEHACPEKTGPDTVTSATLRTHTKPHSLEWSTLDLDELVVNDGPYKLFIEVTESENEPGELYDFFFDKTPAAYTREIGVVGALASLELNWKPELPGSSANDAGN